MSKFEAIRPYYDSEVNDALRQFVDDPMMKAIMHFTFPDVPDQEWQSQLVRTHSIRDFQVNFIYHAVLQVLRRSSDGLFSTGFDKLEKNTAYLFISNHRDIILDTSLLNALLYENGCKMTASAIGDNLVKKPFLKALAKLTRSFIVHRGLSSRAMLESSKLNSEYIRDSIFYENRSVWIAQREGRTKDGNDMTQKGVLKMLSMACEDGDLAGYFKHLKIVPVSISYENDPTDLLKMPELLAKARSETYIKDKNEDFRTLLSGIMGQKKRIHIALGEVMRDQIDTIFAEETTANRQLQRIGEEIDRVILSNFRLWPTNYIALDLLEGSTSHAQYYTQEQKEEFEQRLHSGVDMQNPVAVRSFLAMYANPVINKQKILIS